MRGITQERLTFRLIVPVAGFQLCMAVFHICTILPPADEGPRNRVSELVRPQWLNATPSPPGPVCHLH